MIYVIMEYTKGAVLDVFSYVVHDWRVHVFETYRKILYHCCIVFRILVELISLNIANTINPACTYEFLRTH